MLWLVQKCANNAALCYYYALTLTHHHTNDTKGGATTAKCKLPLFLTCRRIMFGRPFIISGQVGGCRAGLLCFCIFPSGQSAPDVPLEPHSNRRRHYIYDGFPPCSYILMVTFVILSAVAQLMPSAVAQQKDGLSFLPLPRLAGWCRC